MNLSIRSLNNMHGIHADLIKVIEHAAVIVPNDAPASFIVTEGLRTLARQKQLFAAGATRTLQSRHLTGHAFDIAVVVGDDVRWDWPLYENMSVNILRAAHEVGVPLEWGGSWTSFKDGPHYQLPFAVYP